MATDCIAQTTFRFQQNSKPVHARFDVAHASSDGGAVLLKAIDTQLGLTARLADALSDPRQAGKIRHQVIELLRQRVFGVACGYADCNDAARLADDPIPLLSKLALRAGEPPWGMVRSRPPSFDTINRQEGPP